MSSVQPYGNLNLATILIIGHDPRLQNSQAEAEKALFLAKHGMSEICQIVSHGNFRLILPMSVQVFYHICRSGLLYENDETILKFMHKARPVFDKAEQGVYQTTGTTRFPAVYGKLFHHRGIPHIPIVHVKQWPHKARFIRYIKPKLSAERELRMTLSIDEDSL